MKPIRKVIDHFGGVTATARIMTARRQKQANGAKIVPVSTQNVYYWINVSTPVEVAIALELESDGFVSRAELRPDIFE